VIIQARGLTDVYGMDDQEVHTPKGVYSDVKRGRDAGDHDEQHPTGRSSVILLGATVSETLFCDVDPVDQMVKASIGGRTGPIFRALSVTEGKGGTGFGNQNDVAIVPSTASTRQRGRLV